MENRIERAFRTQADLYHSASSELSPLLRQGADLILRTLKGGGKFFSAGMGGVRLMPSILPPSLSFVCPRKGTGRPFRHWL